MDNVRHAMEVAHFLKLAWSAVRKMPAICEGEFLDHLGFANAVVSPDAYGRADGLGILFRCADVFLEDVLKDWFECFFSESCSVGHCGVLVRGDRFLKAVDSADGWVKAVGSSVPHCIELSAASLSTYSRCMLQKSPKGWCLSFVFYSKFIDTDFGMFEISVRTFSCTELEKLASFACCYVYDMTMRFPSCASPNFIPQAMSGWLVDMGQKCAENTPEKFRSESISRAWPAKIGEACAKNYVLPSWPEIVLSEDDPPAFAELDSPKKKDRYYDFEEWLEVQRHESNDRLRKVDDWDNSYGPMDVDTYDDLVIEPEMGDYDDEDREADSIYDMVENHMDSRRKKRREEKMQ
jgi:hypothetical protein